MKIKIQLVIIGVVLFLITILLDFMFNLLSADNKVVVWYNKNYLWFFVIAGVLVLLGIILTVISIIKNAGSNVETPGSKANETTQTDEDKNFLRKQLERHKENRRKLLKQKSVYANGEEPLHLLNQIAAEQKKIQEIEQQLQNLGA